MNGFAGFLARSLRGVRLVEFGALVVLLAMVLSVYLAKAAAGRERGDITAVQQQIDDDQHRLRLLQAEVARLEEPARLERLSAMVGLGPTSGKHEGEPEELSRISQAALVPEKAVHKTASSPAQPGAGAVAVIKTGAPQ